MNDTPSHQSSSFDLDSALEHVRHYLPTQAPLKDFIHHNTLHAFQDRAFSDAIAQAGKMFGARITLSVAEYEQLKSEGKIDDSILSEIQAQFPGLAPRANPAKGAKIRDAWRRLLGEDIAALVNPLLFRLTSQFLDQGIAYWPMPGASEKPFYDCVRDLCRSRGPSLPPLTDRFCRDMLQKTPRQCIEQCLELLVGEPALRGDYLWETLQEHPGWSGLVSVLEINPELLLKARRISLVDFTAIKLLLEVGTLRNHLGHGFKPLKRALSVSNVPTGKRGPALEDTLQTALEETYYHRVAAELLRGKSAKAPETYSAQAFFCIDDRECAFRRHLESVDPSIEVFNYAGFFGVDAMILNHGELYPLKSCPAPLKPKHILKEKPHETKGSKDHHRVLKLMAEVHGGHSKTLLSGLAQLPISGIKATLRLVLDVLNPMAHARAYGLDRVKIPGKLHIQADENDAEQNHPYRLGYTLEEMAQRVSGVLRSCGLTKNFAPLIAIIGHGSSSVNNPYFAAYDCGACSGKPGAPNAKAFATMANLPEVRQRLALTHGIAIPETTIFVAGLHDTCREEIELFDIADLPEPFRLKALAFKNSLEKALDQNAIERCEKFDLIPKNITGPQARKALLDRALSIFEPRPELNHAGNASCIVGRGELTKGISFDRRSFLQSYDPSTDPDGEILNSLLSAVIPVCAGINLEYYFSRLDPAVYGAGSKLPHNITGLVGIINGAEGDILTGLPTQMTELHDPIRLMVVIEQRPETILSVMKRNPNVAQWVENEWVHLFVLETNGPVKSMRRFRGGHFETYMESVTQ